MSASPAYSPQCSWSSTAPRWGFLLRFLLLEHPRDAAHQVSGLRLNSLRRSGLSGSAATLQGELGICEGSAQSEGERQFTFRQLTARKANQNIRKGIRAGSDLGHALVIQAPFASHGHMAGTVHIHAIGCESDLGARELLICNVEISGERGKRGRVTIGGAEVRHLRQQS